MINPISKYILRYNEKNNNELKYDFMPDILEIIERPAHKAGKIIIFTIFILFITAILWSVIAKTDIVVTAQGNITPEGDVVAVQSYLSGTVKNISVSEGQHINKGDLLLELNSNDSQTDISYIKSEISITKDEIDLYEKIIAGTKISEISLDDYDKNSRSNLEVIIENENDYMQSLQALQNTLKSAELDYNSAVSTRKKYENNEEYTNQLENQRQIESQKKIEKDNAELNVKNYKTKHTSELNTIYSEKKSKLSELSSQLQKSKISSNYQKIYAPTSGYVNKMAINSNGDIVSPYKELLTIVPSDVPMQMKCYINNKDIANIKEGDEARVKLDAYSYSEYGVVNGKIKSISPDTYTIENIGNVYQVIVELDNKNENIDIISGLSGIVEIKTGERSILSYFIEPLLNGIDDALKEQ